MEDYIFLENHINVISFSELGCVKSINNIDVKKNQPKPLYAIILTPTRELAMQVKAQLTDVAKYTG